MVGHMVGGVGGVEGVGMEGKSGKRLGKERTRIEGQEHADEHVRKSRRVGGTSVLRPTHFLVDTTMDRRMYWGINCGSLYYGVNAHCVH